MAKDVNLPDVVDMVTLAGDEAKAYVNRRDGELVMIMEEYLSIAEDGLDDTDRPEWEREAIADARRVLDDGDFVALPDQYDIHEYAIMEQFCHTVEDERMREKLLMAIKGKGAFRRFKDTVFREGIEKDWFAYKDAEISKIVADFLDSENIAYQDKPLAG